MTICAAAIGPDGVWVGCDGHAQGNYTVVSRSAIKWTVSPCGLWAISEQGEGSFGAALEDLTAPSDFWPSDTGRDGVRQLASQLRAGFLGLGSHVTPTRKADDKNPFLDWNWAPIVATPQGVWRVCSDLWTVQPAIDGIFYAAGSGDEVALGAMSALYAAGCRSARQLVAAAVDTASRLSVGCGGERWMRCMEAATARHGALRVVESR